MPDPIKVAEDDIISQYGRHIIEDENRKERIIHPPPGPQQRSAPAEDRDARGRWCPPPDTTPPVGIIGAGCAGLYAALIFDSLGIKYEILEAADRIGGRVHTHHFTPKPGQPKGTHDYYDLGPMRFPETRIMQRLFDLFKYDKINSCGISVKDKLIPYFFDTKDGNGIEFYNGRRKRLNVASGLVDPFNVQSLNVDVLYIKIGYDKIYGDVIGPFAKGLEEDLENHSDAGWKRMLEFDSFSTRSYMCHKYVPSPELVALGLPAGKHLPTDVVNWMETVSMTTGWYDRALTTTVLEELAFGFSTDPEKPKTKFWCLDGGSEVLTNAMAEYLERQHPGSILRQHRVTSISIRDKSQGLRSPLSVTYLAGKNCHPQFKTYSHVIATAPTTVLRHAVDLTDAELSPRQTNALRACNYTPATKIGMKFKSAWWTAGKDARGRPIVDRDGHTLNIVGGRSFTDRPIRIVVYPSYGLDSDGPAVLICSFVWTEDAARIGALIGSNDPAVDKQLKDLVFRDLADLHNVHQWIIEDQFLDIFNVDWADDPMTMGSFALFGPGKFGTMYSSLTLPAGRGRLHFAGEAVSIRHGWIVGALDSTWRAVYEYLTVARPDLLGRFCHLWGFNNEWLNVDPSEKRGSVDPFSNSLLLEHMDAFVPEVFDLPHFLSVAEELEGAGAGENAAAVGA